jgi:hypothetical protein
MGGYLVAWGMLRGNVNALTARITALEGEMSSLRSLEMTVAKIGERQDMWIEQLKDLNASIRWMRSEPSVYEPAPLPGVTAPRR